MKTLFLTLLAVFLTVGIGLNDAEAKRLGGGSSLGMQRQVTPPPQAPRQSATPQQPAAPAATPAQQPRRSWMGPVAGLAAGLGLAALFSHLGLGEEFASFFMLALLALVAVAVVRMLMRKRSTASPTAGMQYAGGVPPRVELPRSPAMPSAPGPSAAPASPFPADFDAEAFARQAKVNFIRLQAAHDAGNLDDIREFTTPEMFAEIRLQMADRGMTEQRTDVVELNAQVLEVVEEAERYVASVRFNGLLREEPQAPPAPFDEIWHMVKARHGGGGWVIAGIQQAG